MASQQLGGALAASEAKERPALLAVLGATPASDPGKDPSGKSWHGRLASCTELPRPRMTWECQRKPREDKYAEVPEWLNASEYRDEPEAFAYKIRILADLLRQSRKTLAYTGAGLSVAAGIEMAAEGSPKGAKSSPLQANPTVAHCIMAELNQRNLLHGWVQQNHDGLPQKAGYRQEDINEIHGSWYDPSNPVVLYSGTLRDDLCCDMEWWADTADLVLVLGTSLSGLNADQCVWKTAGRSFPSSELTKNQKRNLRKRGKTPAVKAAALGSVIISPQRTPDDGDASLRLFATADEVMAAVAKEFNIPSHADPSQRRATFSSERRVKVPYDKDGKKSDKVQTWWDLSPGAKLKVSTHNNVEGAQQDAYLHITPQNVGEALPLNQRSCYISIVFDRSTSMQLGVWWIDAALRGGPEYLPVVNVNSIEEPL